ncbi:hypothetical protein TNCV_3280381 [Trichonephila clavipes]|nr:hypothetical protein TNCV_3280381 [Trichonephila clavipes]
MWAGVPQELLKSKKSTYPPHLGVTLDPELRFSKHIEQTTKHKALGKLNILRKLCGTSWGSKTSNPKSTFCTVIRPVLGICATPNLDSWSSISLKLSGNLILYNTRAAKIILLEQRHQPTMKRLNKNAACPARKQAQTCHYQVH